MTDKKIYISGRSGTKRFYSFFENDLFNMILNKLVNLKTNISCNTNGALLPNLRFDFSADSLNISKSMVGSQYAIIPFLCDDIDDLHWKFAGVDQCPFDDLVDKIQPDLIAHGDMLLAEATDTPMMLIGINPKKFNEIAFVSWNRMNVVRRSFVANIRKNEKIGDVDRFALYNILTYLQPRFSIIRNHEVDKWFMDVITDLIEIQLVPPKD